MPSDQAKIKDKILEVVDTIVNKRYTNKINISYAIYSIAIPEKQYNKYRELIRSYFPYLESKYTVKLPSLI